jgi:hypothetical protein
VDEAEGEMDSRLAPQPESASQLRITLGSQPRRCQELLTPTIRHKLIRKRSRRVERPFFWTSLRHLVEKNRYLCEWETRDLKVRINV